MNVPPEISQWLVDKLERHSWLGIREPRTVTHEFKRNTGGMSIRAGLTASIRPAETFSVSYPSDPEAAMFIPGVRDGMFSVLLRPGSSAVLHCAIAFEKFWIYDTESSIAAFAWASKETTELLLRGNESHRDVVR